MNEGLDKIARAATWCHRTFGTGGLIGAVAIIVVFFVAVGAGIGFHVFNSLTEINDTLTDWAGWSPFHYYLGNDPLNNGMDWGNAAVLAAISVVLIAASLVFFQRRDIRQTG